MSYHVLHVIQHGTVLSKDRGLIVCKFPDAKRPPRHLPLEDVRLIVIAARGVTITSALTSALLEKEAVILHCNESYQPCGMTVALPRVVDSRVFTAQFRRPLRLNNALWRSLLLSKTRNQIGVLRRLRAHTGKLAAILADGHIDEGNCARYYWREYFPAIGWAATSRDRKFTNPPNQMLNYGYAVLATLCHRSLLVHGLCPQLGVNHLPHYRSNPLVYDLMEAFRPYVEDLLAEFVQRGEEELAGCGGMDA